jgi:hypothetical protein
MRKEFAPLLPRDKHDVDTASALVAAGWEPLIPFIPQMLEWMQDMNWPVAQVFQPFLVASGADLAPFVKAVLLGEDDVSKHSDLVYIVAHSPELAFALRDGLDRLSNNPSAGEVLQEVSLQAQAILSISSSRQ